MKFEQEENLMLNKLVEKKLTGIFHACSTDTSTPYSLAEYLLKRARGVKNVLQKASIDEFLKTVDNPIRYPKYGGLGTEYSQKQLGIKFSNCREIIDQLISQGIGKGI